MLTHRRIRLTLILAATLNCACGGEDNGGQASCITGEVRSCPCAANAEGAQTCGVDGTFGECSCFAADGGAGDASLPDASTALACEQPLVCPASDANKLTVCGQLVDTESGNPLREAVPVSACESPPTRSTGPCAIEIQAHDLLAFATNPAGSVPLNVDETFVDECGRYRVSNISLPSLGFVGLVTNDAAGANNEHLPTVQSVPIPDSQQAVSAALYNTRHSTDASWTSTAGQPFGLQTFGERGVFLGRFLHNAIPVQGVVVTRNGATQPAQDFYFATSNIGATRSEVAAASSSTGPNGSALLVDSSLENHSGTGAEPSGCNWPSAVVDAVPGVVWVLDLAAACP